MKKILCFAPVSILSALLLLPGMAGPARAASARASTPTMQVAPITMMQINWRRGWHPSGWRPGGYGYYGAPQINNQYFRGNSDSGNVTHSVGNNQANTGNEGWNRHALQDNSVNAGNQVINRREPAGYRINNQYFLGNGNTRNRFFLRGNNLDNSGNEGINDGVVQDNSTNAGNQVIN